MAALNALYRAEASLVDSAQSFRWLVPDDAAQSVLAWSRHPTGGGQVTVWVANFTPVPRDGYRIGLPVDGVWQLMLNSDDPAFGGSGYGAMVGPRSDALPCHGHPWSTEITVPPLGLLVLGLRR